ncbi:hypothetical protein AB4Z33_15160 [Paenibacillus sp. 2TAB19]
MAAWKRVPPRRLDRVSIEWIMAAGLPLLNGEEPLFGSGGASK